MWIESFLEYLKLERNYSPRTVKSYGDDLREFERYFRSVDEGLDFAAVDSDIIRAWMVFLMEHGNAATSVNRKLSALRSFYRFLLRTERVETDPMRKVVGPKKKKPLPVFVRDNDMNRLLDEMASEEGFEACRDRMIIEVFYATGMRRAELVGLSDADVDFSAMQIKVTGKRNKQRLIPFGDALKNDLLEYVKQRDETIPEKPTSFFVRKDGKPMSAQLVYNLVRRNLSKVVTLKKKSPHVLRHAFATTMLNHEADLGAVKDLLGHASLKATEVYTHTTFEELKKVYKQAHPRA
jgi:integrase/recombinase XerC